MGYGDGCEFTACPKARGPDGTVSSCGGRGKCDGNGLCICSKGFTGVDCSTRYCGPDSNCNGHGSCVNEVCECDEGFAGAYCTRRTCPTSQLYSENDCSGHGACSSDGTCKCVLGWAGRGCGMEYCPQGCNNRGKCNKGAKRCDCMLGFEG